MIVDDLWLGFGSVAANRRAMNLDAGLSVAIVDEEGDLDTSKFVQALHANLWAEHLGLGSPDSGSHRSVGSGRRVRPVEGVGGEAGLPGHSARRPARRGQGGCHAGFALADTVRSRRQGDRSLAIDEGYVSESNDEMIKLNVALGQAMVSAITSPA